MSRTITWDSNGNDITCMKKFDALKFPCDTCDIKDCPEKEECRNCKFLGEIYYPPTRDKDAMHLNGFLHSQNQTEVLCI